MEFLGEVWEYFTTAENWEGELGMLTLLRDHVVISALATAIAAVIAFPAGLFVGHKRKGEFLIVSIANAGRAIPTFAILVFLVPFSIRLGLGIGFWPTLIALVALAIPPLLTNSYVGIQAVDSDTIEAARGMGMTEMGILGRIEIPLAAPLIMAGVRIAALQVVATATLAALVGWGGLGRIIVDGFAVRRFPKIFAGALLVAGLALVVDFALGFLARAVSPRTATATRKSGPGRAEGINAEMA